MASRSISNVAEFNRAVQDFTKNLAPRELVLVHKKVALEALARLVEKTPVDTGRARGNWQTTINSSPEGEINTLGAEVAIDRGKMIIQSIQPFSVLYLTNNVPYIRVLEFGEFDPPNPGPSKDPRTGRTGRILVKGGFSTQAPRGMMTVTIAELRRIFP